MPTRASTYEAKGRFVASEHFGYVSEGFQFAFDDVCKK